MKLLKDQDKNIEVTSNMADEYVNIQEENKVTLKRDYLNKYMGFVIEAETVVEILKSLEFKVEVLEDRFEITAPTFRSTKDITNAADIIEEIARIYGYNNLKPEPLKLALVVNHSDGNYKIEYNLKKKLAEKAKLNEVHTYLWYNAENLAKLNINKDNNILRDDLSLSLLEVCFENSKHTQEYGIFEIASVMGKVEERHLSIMNVCIDNNVEKTYMAMKQLIYEILKEYRNKEVKFEVAKVEKDYIDNDYTLNIIVDGKVLGYISLIKKEVSKNCSKKTSIVNVEINVTELLKITTDVVEDEEVSKYPTTTLDYTIITEKEVQYAKIEEMLNKYSNNLLKRFYLYDIYTDDVKKTTVRFEIGLNDRTLTREDILAVQEGILKHIQENGFNVVGK